MYVYIYIHVYLYIDDVYMLVYTKQLLEKLCHMPCDLKTFEPLLNYMCVYIYIYIYACAYQNLFSRAHLHVSISTYSTGEKSIISIDKNVQSVSFLEKITDSQIQHDQIRFVVTLRSRRSVLI